MVTNFIIALWGAIVLVSLVACLVPGDDAPDVDLDFLPLDTEERRAHEQETR